MRKFDFLVVPVCRAGGTAVQRFLSLHPQLFALPKWNLDGQLNAGTEQELLVEAQDFMRSHRDVKVGLVQHDFITQECPHGDVVERLARIVDADGLILVFREPLGALRSLINHVVLTRFCRYKFGQAGLPWIGMGDLADAPRVLADRARAEAERSEERERKYERLQPPEQITDSHWPQLSYGAVVESYGRHFRNPLVVDFEDLAPGRVAAGMSRMFAFLGVDPGFHHPFFETSQGGTPQRFMAYNPINVMTGSADTLRLFLCYRSLLKYANDQEYVEIAGVSDAYTEDLTGSAGGLALVVDPYAWYRNSRKVRISLQARLETLFEEAVYPLWRESFARVMEETAPYRLEALGQPLKERLMPHIADDLGRFVAHHPEFEARWPEACGYLGATPPELPAEAQLSAVKS